MAWFNNMRIGAKLLLSFSLLVLLVGGVVGGLSYSNINNLNGILAEITQQRVPSVKNSTGVERYALRTILDEKRYLLTAYDTTADEASVLKSAMANLDQITKALDEVDKVATKYNDQDLLAKSKDVRKATEEYRTLYNQGVAKIDAKSKAEDVWAVKGDAVVKEAQSYFDNRIKDNTDEGRQAVQTVVSIWATAYDIRLNANKYMARSDPKNLEAMKAGFPKINQLYEDLRKVSKTPEDLQRIDTAKKATADYQKAADDWLAADKDLTAILTQMNTIGTKVQDNAVAAEDAGWTAAAASEKKANEVVSQAISITIIGVIVALLLGIGLGVVIPRSITLPMATMAEMLTNLGVGNLNRHISQETRALLVARGDEIGILAKGVVATGGYLRGMADAAGKIAKGDLTVNIKPNSDLDELGVDFAEMIESLRESVGEVQTSANQVTEAASQLNSAASQAGTATQQISGTTQQVSKGTQDQASAAQAASRAIEQLTHAINQVAQGAQDQARQIQETSQLISRHDQAVQSIVASVEDVTDAAHHVTAAAVTGTERVDKTASGMAAIQKSVTEAAATIQTLGDVSSQIGTIVEAIEDIAEQTNLLALNAAIEAARAGEHGKGFAVVADEVRKLAERASRSTKEIADLITKVQRGTGEAVQAMRAGVSQVEAGTILSREALEALSEIRSSAEVANSQVAKIALATNEVKQRAQQVSQAIEAISAVVEESTAATEEMSATAADVRQSAESVAAVSEQNSAAAEEVSASTEEMSAQVEEVMASAESLSEMAGTLQEVVNRFQLEDESSKKPQARQAAAVKPRHRTGH